MRAILLVSLIGCASAEGEPHKLAAGEGPLVIELFTSQGCSSCPPAERLLDKLARTDASLAPLAFHVDYWNDLGWADPYSSPAWTERQHQYAQALHDDRVYTPELVVGSNTSEVAHALASVAHPARLSAKATWSTDQLAIFATAPADADVWVAVWEDGTRTEVTRGENSGETLPGDRVVRRFARVATAGQDATVQVALDPSWGVVSAVAFAQRPDRRIVASALLPR
jgi:hypothetical protein